MSFVKSLARSFACVMIPFFALVGLGFVSDLNPINSVYVSLTVGIIMILIAMLLGLMVFGSTESDIETIILISVIAISLLLWAYAFHKVL